MRTELKNNVLTVFLGGRVDSTSAPQIEAEIFEAMGSTPHDELIIDAEELLYISSAGLRVMLKVRKTEQNVKIVNVSTDVYEIFEMTGFNEMIPIEKAYRRFSIEGCEVVGKGANGTVYRIDEETIIKVYKSADALPDIKKERELARKAFVMGINTAIPYDVAKVGDTYGSVFELLNAKSFAKLIKADPANLDSCVDRSVELLWQMHGNEIKEDDMPDMREVGINWCKFVRDYLPAEIGEKLVAMAEAIEPRNTLLHGDYHIKNIMLQNGETLLIDMDTLCYGHPIYELASMYNAYVGFLETPEGIVDNDFLGIGPVLSQEFWDKSLRRYLKSDDEEYVRSVETKARILGYTRLMRRLIRRKGLEEQPELVNYYKEKLIELIPTVDSLSF